MSIKNVCKNCDCPTELYPVEYTKGKFLKCKFCGFIYNYNESMFLDIRLVS